MMLTSKIPQVEPSLEALSPVSDEPVNAEKNTFSGLFSSIMGRQERVEFDSLHQIERPKEDEIALTFKSLQDMNEQTLPPINNGVVGDVVTQLKSLTPSDLKGDTTTIDVNLKENAESGDVLMLEQAPLNLYSSPRLAEPAMDDVAVLLPVEAEREVVLESSNEISPPPLILTSIIEEAEPVLQGTGIENQLMNKLSQPLDSGSSNASLSVDEEGFQEERVEWDVTQDKTVMQESVSNQTGAPVFNSLNQQNSHSSLNQPSTSWGAMSSEGQASQSFGQASQQGFSQSTQQQSIFFAQQASQVNQESKQRSIEQQMAVKAMDDSIAKPEGKELLGGAEIASFDRKVSLPIGLQSINLPLKHPQWGQALGQRIVFMSNNSLQQAHITLNPQSLGQIQVTLQLDKDQKMHINLAAQNGITRESMENALPRLREMMEQAGIQVASVDVREQKQHFSENDSGHTQHEKNGSKNALAEAGFVEEPPLETIGLTDNIVDYYA